MPRISLSVKKGTCLCICGWCLFWIYIEFEWKHNCQSNAAAADDDSDYDKDDDDDAERERRERVAHCFKFVVCYYDHNLMISEFHKIYNCTDEIQWILIW